MSADDVLPVAVIGGGPIGLTTALGLEHYGVPVAVFEDDSALSLDTKAGSILTRTLEVWARYGAIDPVLRASMRLDEIGEIDRATNASTGGVDGLRLSAVVLDSVRALDADRSQHRKAPFSQSDHPG